ncbi:MAG: hypothetical protein ABEH83_03290 [Halobacterium sp.]
MPGAEDAGRDWRLLARAAGFGAALAAVLFYGLVAVAVVPRRASEVAFSLPALAFAVGLLGWSGVVMSGDAMEGFSRELGISEGFSAAGARQAMAVLVAFGGGGMVGAAVAALPYGV